MNILITGGTLLPMTAEDSDVRKFYRGSVGIEGNRIVMVTDQDEDVNGFRTKYEGNLTEIDATDKIVMPGLINTHTHSPMSLLRGFMDDVALMDWLCNHIWPLEAKLKPEDCSVGAELAIAEMFLGGTTSFIDMYHFERAVAKTVIQTGARAVLSPFFLDLRMEEFKNDLLQTIDTVKGCSRAVVMVAPHAPYTCSDENLTKGLKFAEEFGLGIHIHLEETAAERPDYMKTHKLSPTMNLCSLGLFDCNTVAAHGVYVSEEEMDVLAEKGVTVAHNPKSNMKLASGFAPVKKYIEHGVNVSIGTDGASSNNNLDMWEEMRTAALMQKALTLDPETIPAYTALKMATVNGAKAMGMEGKLGILKEGALADIILVDQTNVHHYPHQGNILSSLVYSCKSSDVDTTIVDGNIVVREGKLTTLNLREIGNRCTELINEIHTRQA